MIEFSYGDTTTCSYDKNENTTFRGGKKIIDFVSGQIVPDTPEEVFATQPFSKMLVEDYGYSKSDIVTRPQFRVKKSPSDKKGYPIDITVFEDGKVKLIVECKEPKIKLTDAIAEQLKIYMSFSGAEIGVLYNGIDSIYIRRIRKGNSDLFEKIPSIPKAGEKLEEIGLYKKGNLVVPHNLKNVFSEIRGWIVANGNVTRDDIIASQVILLILCKIYDERFTESSENLLFRATLNDTDEEIEERIQKLFVMTSNKYEDVIEKTDAIQFDGKTLRGIIGRLQNYNITRSDRDCIADAFEVFIDKAVKEAEGQFFTPRNVVQVIIEAVDVKKNMKVIDSACGSGGFLVETLKRIEEEVEIQGNKCGWTREAKREEIKEKAIKNIRGIEKDPFLTKLAKSYMAILGDGKGGIFREDSLEEPKNWKVMTQKEVRLGTFDVCLANPPFGKNIKVEGEAKLKQFQLAHSTNAKGKKTLQKTGNVSSLFLERNLQLVRQGGIVAIILPEPYFNSPSYNDAIDLMCHGNNILWVIDLPHNTFRPHNNAKCCAIVIQKGVPQQEMINMAVLEHIGHDLQGKPLYDKDGVLLDDSLQVKDEIKGRNKKGDAFINPYEHPLTFQVSAEKVKKLNILVPRYYWHAKVEELKSDAKKNGIKFVSLRQLIEEGIITWFDGHGSPDGNLKGTGEVPYIRVKDIVNWQPYIDVTSLIPREEYEKKFSPKKALQPKDILYVSRGSYRIGSVAMISPYDGEMLLTREIKVIRFLQENNKYGITPEYLCYAMSHRLVWEQTKTKVFYEPCLPNIAGRWLDIEVPIFEDTEKFEEIKCRASSVFKKLWAAKETIQDLRENADAYLI